MEERNYAINLHVPLGDRPGILRLTVKNGACQGSLFVMHGENPVQGVIAPDGRCRLTGEVHTLLRAYPLEGEGSLTGNTADLTLRCGRMRCRLTGKRVRTDG